MTDWEKAVVTAYTGISMLEGKKFKIFHRYIEEKLGRPIFTHELASASIEREIKEAVKEDFFAVCTDTVSDDVLHKYDDMQKED